MGKVRPRPSIRAVRGAGPAMGRRDIARENAPAALRHVEPVGNVDRRHAFVRAHSGARSRRSERGRCERGKAATITGRQYPSFVIRRQQYLADLDGDGHLEFAVFPFSPGSAIWGTVRIYSIKDEIEPWGLGRYRFELDTFVQLDCMRCSKFNPEECEKCR